MAAVTHRLSLGCVITSPELELAAMLKPITALHTLSRGRVAVGLALNNSEEQAVAALSAAGSRIFTTGSEFGAADGVICEGESASQFARAGDGHIEVWVAIPFPPDREAWARTLNQYEAAGAGGVIVPWNARVVDLLRNPEADDRTDLLISTG